MKLPIVKDNMKLTKKEEEVLVGTLLGDSSIICGKNYAYLSFCHESKQSIYFFKKYNILKRTMSSYSYKDNLITNFTNNGKFYYATGRSLKCLRTYRDIFYPNGKKSIPMDFIKDRFTNISLSYLFMDEGCKNCNTINLNMQSFNREELQNFINFLEEKFNLKFIIKKDKTLYLRYESRKIFFNLVKNYITPDTEYKLAGIMLSLNLVNLGKSGNRQPLSKHYRNIVKEQRLPYTFLPSGVEENETARVQGIDLCLPKLSGL
jgi:hypothetical protein